MKFRKHNVLGFKDIPFFATEHLGESFMFYKVTSNYVDIVQETEQTEAELHMEHLHTLLECDEYLTEEEKAAIEYAIECIKTLDDMGIIKENNNDD